MFLALFIFITMIMCTHTYGAVCVIWTIVLFFMTFFFGERKIFFFIRWLLFCFLIRKNNKTFLHIYFIFFCCCWEKKTKNRIHYIICRVADVEKSRTQKSPRHLIRLYILYIKLYTSAFFFFLSFLSSIFIIIFRYLFTHWCCERMTNWNGAMATRTYGLWTLKFNTFFFSFQGKEDKENIIIIITFYYFYFYIFFSHFIIPYITAHTHTTEIRKKSENAKFV